MTSNLNLNQINIMKRLEFMEKDIKKLYETLGYLDARILKVHQIVNEKLCNDPKLTDAEIACAQNYSDN